MDSAAISAGLSSAYADLPGATRSPNAMTPASMARRPARKGAPDDVARRSPSPAAIAAAAPRKSPFIAMGLSLNGIVPATLLVARVPLYHYERRTLYLRLRHRSEERRGGKGGVST